MAVTGTAQLADEVKPLYDSNFIMQTQMNCYQDQFFNMRKEMNGQRGSSYRYPILYSLAPNTSQLNELTDVASQLMNVNEVTVTLGEYGGAVDVTRLAVALSYADVYKQAAYANGYNVAESIDLIARAVIGQGSRRYFPNARTSRATLNGPTTEDDRISAPLLEQMAIQGRLQGMPLYEDGALCTSIHPYVYYDLQQDPGVRLMSQYSHPEILFNGELGYWSGVRMVVTGNNKAFYSAGAANASPISTTVASSIAAGDDSFTITATTNVDAGDMILVGTIETGNTWYDTNELFIVTGVVGSVVSGYALQGGPSLNGGFRYAHAAGATVSNAATVYPTTFLGPESLTKVCSDFTGPYGETVVSGPFDKLGRFLTFGWWLIAGWSRTIEPWLFRLETGSSLL